MKAAIIAAIILSLLVIIVLALRPELIVERAVRAALAKAEPATGVAVTVGEVKASLFPLHVEVRDLDFARAGTRIGHVDSVTAYIELLSLFGGRVSITRLKVTNPDIDISARDIAAIRDAVSTHGAGPVGGESKVALAGSVFVINTAAAYRDPASGIAIHMDGGTFEAAIKDEPRLTIDVRALDVNAPGAPAGPFAIKGSARLKSSGVLFDPLTVTQGDSSVTLNGTLSREQASKLAVKGLVKMSAVEQALGANERSDGEVRAGGSLTFNSGWSRPSDISLDMSVEGGFELGALIRMFVPEDRDYAGDVTFRGRLKGRVADLNGEGHVEIAHARFFMVRADHLSSPVRYENNVLSFDNGEGTLYGGRAGVDVALKLPHLDHYGVHVKFKGLNSGPAFGMLDLGWLPLMPGVVDGDFHTEGAHFQPRGKVEYRSSQPGSDLLGRIYEVGGSYSIKGDVVRLEGFRVHTPFSKADFSGTVDTASGRMDFGVSAETSDIGEMARPYADGLRGASRLEGRIRGSTHSPSVEVRAVINGAGYGTYRLGSGDATFAYSKGVLTVKSAKLSEGPSTHQADGTITFPLKGAAPEIARGSYALNLSSDGVIIGQIVNSGVVNGVASGAVTVGGSGSAPELSGTLRLRDGVLWGVKVASGIARGSLKDGRLMADGVDLSIGTALLHAEGKFDKGGRFEFKAGGDSIPLGALLGISVPVSDQVSISAEGGGTIEQPEVTVKADVVSAAGNGLSLAPGKLEIVVSGKSMRVTGDLMGHMAGLNGTATLTRGFPWEATLALEFGRYDSVVGYFMKNKPKDFSLALEGKLLLRGGDGGFGADLVLSRLHAHLYEQSFVNLSEIRMTYSGGRLSIVQCAFKSSNAMLSASGEVEPGKSYNLTVSGTASIAPLALLVKQFEAARGAADFSIGVTGPWAKPSVDGKIEINDAVFALKDQPYRFTNVKGKVLISNRQVTIEKIEGQIGGGTVSASGLVALDGFEMRRYSLDLQASDVAAHPVSGASLKLSGRLLVSGNKDERAVSGELFLNHARYTQRIDWKSWLMSRKRDAARPAEPWQEKTSLNVHLYGVKDIVVDNNVLNAPLQADVLVRGTVAHPVFIGRVEAAGGRFFFRNSDFRIIKATADYTESGGKVPYIDITAETDIKGYRVRVHMEGKANQMDLNMASEPSLDEVEILSLLSLGEFGKGLKGMEGGIGAAEATSLLTGRVQDVFEDKVHQLTGLDRVQISPYVSQSTGTVAPRVTVSKKLVGNRLMITYAYSIDAAPDEEIKLEYILTDHVSVEGGQDATRSVGGDLKLRFSFE